MKLNLFLNGLGEKQLISTIEERLPQEIKESKNIDKYVEPFIGGGALFFYLMNNYKIKESYIFDINKELILTYNVIKNNHRELIEKLSILQEEYVPRNQDDRKEYYLNIKSTFNNDIVDFENYSEEHITRASYTIFMK